MKEELYSSLSMIPAIPYSLYVAYNLSKHSYQYITSPLWYAILCLISTIHHYKYYKKGVVNHTWFRMDLIAQLIMCILTVIHTSQLKYIILPFLVMMMSIQSYLKLHINKHRYIAYGMNGIGILLSTGPYPFIILHWLLSFTCFGIGFIYPNNFTHTFFHIYNHINMSMVWNTFI